MLKCLKSLYVIFFNVPKLMKGEILENTEHIKKYTRREENLWKILLILPTWACIHSLHVFVWIKRKKRRKKERKKKKKEKKKH